MGFLEKYLIAFVVFSVIIATGLLVIPDINTNYNKNMSTSEFTGVYNSLDEMYNTTQDMKEDTLGGEAEDDSTWESMIKGAYSAIRLLKNSFTIVGDVGAAIAKTVGIPAFIIDALIIIVVIMVIFALIYMIFRFKS